MSYRLNKTDGTLLVELVDGKVDSSTTNLTFIGKNYQGFGEFLNENFIKLLESFSNSTAPNKPVKGQLWYDSASGRLKVYDGVTFRSTDSTLYAATQPDDLIEGDIWIDGSSDQMYFWNGTEVVLVGPSYNKTQGVSSNVVETIRDTTGQNKIVVKFYIGGSLVGIHAKEDFTPYPPIVGFNSLETGFNISSVFADYTWLGTANSAKQIIDELGNVFDQNSFLSTTGDDTTQGRIHIQNDNGLLVGNDSDHEVRIDGTTTTFKNNLTNSDWRLQLRDGGGTYEAMYIDTDLRRMGIFKNNPQYELDVVGSAQVSGDLYVRGDVFFGTITETEINTLRVADTQIQLAITEDSTLLDSTSSYLDDAGIAIETGGGSIKWTYQLDNDSWSSTQDINLRESTGEYQIETVKVIDKTSLGSTVVNSNLQTLGTLQSLVVDDITIDGNEISSATGNGIDVDIIGSFNFTNNVTGTRVSGVKTPISARDVVINPLLTESDGTDAATKDYVDAEVAAVQVISGIDITGLGTGATLQNNVAIMLEELQPAAGKPNGSIARLHTTAFTATTDPIDVNANISKTFTAVDSAGVQNVNVIGDFTISDPSAAVGLTVVRTIMEYKVLAATWTYQSTTASAV